MLLGPQQNRTQLSLRTFVATRILPSFLLRVVLLLLLLISPTQSFVVLSQSKGTITRCSSFGHCGGGLIVVPTTTTTTTSSNQLFASVDVSSSTSLSSPSLSLNGSKSRRHDDDDDVDNPNNNTNVTSSSPSLRSRLRKLTGFSLTAFRTSARAFVTAIYIATMTATGAWIRQLTKYILSIFPPAARYFFQPLLILYYAPLFILKNWTGPTHERAKQSHEHVMEGWKSAVQKADDKMSYWPIHVSTDGTYFETDEKSLELEQGIAESVNVAMDISMNEQDKSSSLGEYYYEQQEQGEDVNC